MRTIICLFFCLFTTFASSENIDKLLLQLDKEVANHQYYIREKQNQIESLKASLDAAKFPAEQYLIYKRLYQAYQKFDSDSAIYYANICLEYGVSHKREDWVNEAELNILKIYSLRSFQPFVNDALNEYSKRDSILPQLRLEYITTLFENQIRVKKIAKGTPYEEACQKKGEYLWNKYAMDLPEDYWSYTYYQRSLVGIDEDLERKTREALEKTKPYSEERALLEVNLAMILKEKGNEEGYFTHLILSAICDIRCANREAQSLLFITDRLQHEASQVKRAFNYALLCEENARIYRDIVRSMDLVSSQSFIEKTYKEQIEQQQLWMYVALFVLAVFLLIIILLFILLKKKQTKQAGDLYEVTEKNDQLKVEFEKVNEVTQKVKETNLLLADKVQQRDFNFINVFYLYSECIQNSKNFRKKIGQFLKTGLINDAGRLASSTKFDEELQKLYTQFDTAFLTIHPDFIDRFNRLLSEEGQIIVKKKDTLTPELRIYALIYLGITNSARIAEFLHYSPQTVYNYRLKVRHTASIPEKDLDEAVKKLYASDSI